MILCSLLGSWLCCTCSFDSAMVCRMRRAVDSRWFSRSIPLLLGGGPSTPCPDWWACSARDRHVICANCACSVWHGVLNGLSCPLLFVGRILFAFIQPHYVVEAAPVNAMMLKCYGNRQQSYFQWTQVTKALCSEILLLGASFLASFGILSQSTSWWETF